MFFIDVRGLPISKHLELCLSRCKHDAGQYAKRVRGLHFLQKQLGKRSQADRLDADLEILELLRGVKEQELGRLCYLMWCYI